jgi:protocatechuate 3,4-dioxygenase, beta subunit
MKLTRRLLVQWLAALPAIAAWSARAQATTLRPTPQDVEGPYYPKTWDTEVDNDLVTMAGRPYPRGTPMALSGRLRSVDGQAIAQARVEIWQADDAANYRHPAGDGEGPAQRGFQGYGFATTDAEGRYSFRTLKPPPYRGRPAHVHFKVIAAGHRGLTTEMYFVGENEEGSWWLRWFGGFSKERDLLSIAPTVRRSGAGDVVDAVFDIVLERAA